MRYSILVLLLLSGPANAICGKAGIVTGTATGVTIAKTSVVIHSSGQLILRGSTGYLAGTMGLAAWAGPIGWTVLGLSAVYIAYDCLKKD